MQHPTRGHSPYSLREWPARHTTLSIVPRSSKLGEPSSASRYSERILFRGTAGAVCERGSEQRYEPSSAEYRPAVDGGGEQEGSFGILWRSTRAASLASIVYPRPGLLQTKVARRAGGSPYSGSSDSTRLESLSLSFSIIHPLHVRLAQKVGIHRLPFCMDGERTVAEFSEKGIRPTVPTCPCKW
jgi:hypothetical protein